MKDHNEKELSGDELQRFACTMACLQDADICMFDEPSSHLDVKQRLNAATATWDLLASAELEWLSDVTEEDVEGNSMGTRVSICKKVELTLHPDTHADAKELPKLLLHLDNAGFACNFSFEENFYFMRKRPSEAMGCIINMYNGTLGTMQLFKVFSFNRCNCLSYSLHLVQTMRLFMAISFRRAG